MNRKVWLGILLVPLLFLLQAPSAFAGRHDLAGHASGEVRGFPYGPLHPRQRRHNGSLAVQPEYRYILDDGSMFTFVPFGRLDMGDGNRTHLDLRECNFLWVKESWELRLGIGKVFWGTTEFVHLVDIINQTDLVEAPDGEEKLGQPMAHLSIPLPWGEFNLFALPWFRERTFPGVRGRLRPPLEIDTDHAAYESGDEEKHTDLAARYENTLGRWDMGLSYFHGTGREPIFYPGHGMNGAPLLLPFYEQIRQTAVDVQGMAGSWLFKLEAFHRDGFLDDFSAITGGVEYSFVDVAGSGADLGIIAEWVYDGRDAGPPTPYDDDIMVGLRAAINDTASSELLFGFVQDRKGSAKMVSLEASRRLGNGTKVRLEALSFIGVKDDDLVLGGLGRDDHVRLEFYYYF